MFDNLITPCILSPPRFCRNHHCPCAFCVKVLKWNKPRYHSSSRINSKFFTPCILSFLTSSVHTQCVPSVIVALSHLVHTGHWVHTNWLHWVHTDYPFKPHTEYTATTAPARWGCTSIYFSWQTEDRGIGDSSSWIGYMLPTIGYAI